MSWVAVGVTAVGAASSIYGATQAGKNLPKSQPLDISKVISDARNTASQTLQDSQALERQYMPGTAQLRNQADFGLGQISNQSTAGFQARNSILDGMTNPVADSSVSSNPLLQGAQDRILGQLNLGGKLDAETQAAVTRGALSGAGSAGISGSGAGQGLVARDLGLTSLGLQNQRQQAALGAGSTIAGLDLQGQNLKLQDVLGRYGAAQGAAGQDIQGSGLLAGIIDARQLPNAGLSASDVSNLYVGNNNASNQNAFNSAAIAQQQRNSNISALLGFAGTAAGAYAGYKGNLSSGAPQTVNQNTGVGKPNH
jgi:hypothetical protein